MTSKNSDVATAAWFKSSYSNGQAACVETAVLDSGEVALRDSKHGTHGPMVTVPAAGWNAFVTAFDRGQ